MIYIIQCPACGKQFRRKSNDTSLRPHKTPEGYRCPGRGRGFLAETRWG